MKAVRCEYPGCSCHSPGGPFAPGKVTHFEAEPNLTQEQVIAELKRLKRLSTSRKAVYFTAEEADMALKLIDQLPDPPKVDVVEECAKEAHVVHGFTHGWDTLTGDSRRSWMNGIRGAIRRYLELRGLPADPELEGK